jgi:hypothetical protein
MTYQAYLDAVEKKTGLTPRQLLDQAAARGYGPDTRAGEIVDWLKTEHGLGHGHAMSIAQLVRKGDTSGELWLDGAATKPAGA